MTSTTSTRRYSPAADDQRRHRVTPRSHGSARIFGTETSPWDPEQPGQHLGGLSQYPCAGARDPSPAGAGFIGDYFGLTISAGNVYPRVVSTHYPSDVTADEGGPVYYQQQVLATVPRSDFGTGY